jgi:hypothetical protein
MILFIKIMLYLDNNWMLMAQNHNQSHFGKKYDVASMIVITRSILVPSMPIGAVIFLWIFMIATGLNWMH